MKQLCILLCLLLLTACTRPDPLEEISAELGVDLSAGTLVVSSDSHGGFHGDGMTAIQIVIPDLKIPESPNWHPLPLSDNLNRAFYGASGDSWTYGALLTDESGHPLLPQVEHGCWFFSDRHSQSTDSADDADLHSRSSWNFTAAVYDYDTATLHFFRFDT